MVVTDLVSCFQCSLVPYSRAREALNSTVLTFLSACVVEGRKCSSITSFNTDCHIHRMLTRRNRSGSPYDQCLSILNGCFVRILAWSSYCLLLSSAHPEGWQDSVSASHYVKLKLEICFQHFCFCHDQIPKSLCNVLTSNFSVGK